MGQVLPSLGPGASTIATNADSFYCNRLTNAKYGSYCSIYSFLYIDATLQLSTPESIRKIRKYAHHTREDHSSLKNSRVAGRIQIPELGTFSTIFIKSANRFNRTNSSNSTFIRIK